jgi:hypothetical protein
MSILGALKTQTESLDDLAALPQAMIMQMAQKGQIREDMLAPILGRKAELADAVARTKALQGQGGQMPTVMEQLMQRNAEAEMPEQQNVGVAQLPVREDMFQEQSMAGGGIVAFEEGGDVDEEREDKDLEDYEYSMIESMMLKKPSMGGDYGIKAEKKAEQPSFGVKADGTPLGVYAMKVAEKYGVDPELASYVMKKETGGMKNPATAVSSAGAQGVMQLMPGTARDMGVKDSFDPYQNIEGGIKYLAMLNKKYDDPKLVAIAYNWGPGNTDKWLKSGADVSKLPAETRKYIAQLAEGGVVGYYAGGMTGIRSTLSPGEEIVEFPDPAVEDQFSFANYMQNLKRQRDEAKTSAEQDKYMALIAAGLGMMGGTSQYAAANIGAGGQKGLESLAQSKKLRAAEAAALDKSELGALRAKGIEDLRQQEIKNLNEYRKGQLSGKADKLLKDEEEKEGRLINKVDGMLNRDPVIKDFTKKMENLNPDDPMYLYYLDEIEKRRADAYERAGLKITTPGTKIGTPPPPKEDPGFWKKLFGSDKPKSGGTIDFDNQGKRIQ